MIYLEGFSRTGEYLAFVGVIEKIVQEAQRPLFLHGFVVTRPSLWIRLRKRFRQGGDSGSFSDLWSRWPMYDNLVAGEEYFTGDGEDTELLNIWSKLIEDRKQPFLVKVCVAPTTPDTVLLRQKIAEACSNHTYFYAIVEDRAPARLASLEGGRGMTASTQAGTIGGFLQNQYGTVLGVTCGHVGKSVNDVTNAQDIGGSTANMGVIVSTNWPLVSSTGLCQPSTAANKVDIALTDISSGLTATDHVRGIGSISGITKLAGLGSGHRVRMCGARSGANDYDITGYATTYRVHDAGSYYCFTGIYEISGVVSNSLLGSYTPTPVLGDSGAWVCCPDDPTGFALCGMLFAVDLSRGYVSFTDEMDIWARSNGQTLSVL